MTAMYDLNGNSKMVNMKKKNFKKPVALKGMQEDTVYLKKRHGYADFFRMKDIRIQSYMQDDKNKYKWFNTAVDEKTERFTLFSEDQMLQALLENKVLDNKKKIAKIKARNIFQRFWIYIMGERR